MKILLTVEQLSRPQPGGIGSYVQGLVRGLMDIGISDDVVTLGPRGSHPVDPLVAHRRAGLGLSALTRGWSRVPFGVPRGLDVVHATSMTGPFSGGGSGARHFAAMHDLLWRDEPQATTPRGVAFHESRLQRIVRDESLRIVASSPLLPERLVELGVDPHRITVTRLGVDDEVGPASVDTVRAVLAERGVSGPYTLSVGTLEPRKNVAALVRAHRAARAQSPDLGPLVVVGPSGWGDVETGDAILLGRQPRDVLLGLYRDASVVAYVPLAEGYGLPPVEALRFGVAVVASATVPSVVDNPTVVRVVPRDESDIAAGLVRALEGRDDPTQRDLRRQSVEGLTWANCARDHLAAWS